MKLIIDNRVLYRHGKITDSFAHDIITGINADKINTLGWLNEITIFTR
jgi:hypothetical protein